MSQTQSKPFNLHGLKTYDLQARPSKVFIEDLGRPVAPDVSLDDWLRSLPRQLAAEDLRRVRDHLVRCHQEGRTVAAALGGHVIKTGCGPYLIDWVERGLLKAVVLNGAAAIHDLELALVGKTSEDVATSLPLGQFGMARDTADALPWPRASGPRTRPAWAGRWDGTSTTSAARIPTRACCWPPTVPASPAPSTSRWGPTSSTCTPTSPGRRWARRR